MIGGSRSGAAAAAALVMVLAVLAGCSNGSGGGGDAPSPDSSEGGGGPKIGLLLPDNANARYESADFPLFEERVAKKCPTCTVLYQNAGADAAKQQQQAQAMLSQGVEVLVISAQDGKAALQIVRLAKEQDVPVLAYDRLIDSPDIAGYISFDNELVGAVQAQVLVDRMVALGLPEDAGYIMVNGSPTDPNAAQFKKGAESVFESTKYEKLAEYDTPDWVPAKAQAWAQGTISKLGADKIQAVYAANDSTGAAVANALAGAGVTTMPPITGQDASLAGIQDVLDGTLHMTIYKAFRPEAYGAADAAVALTQGKKPKLDLTIETPSGTKLPATLLDPVAVTADTIQATVVKDGFYTAAQICTADYAKACAEHGVK